MTYSAHLLIPIDLVNRPEKGAMREHLLERDIQLFVDGIDGFAICKKWIEGPRCWDETV